MTPKDAQVYVDRYYAGVVDDYDGVFQHLTLRPGAHLVEIRKTGYRSLAIEVNLYPGESITYRRAMEPSTEALEGCSPVTALPPGVEEGAAPPPFDLSASPGDVKFDVTPNTAEIDLDGFYAGIVNDFNGSQHLQVAAGRHHVSLKAPGYETIDVELSIASDQTITYRATMKKSP
ncbi:MAG TPA: PEGA domain-containing protein [Vicinamibacterales bacterium]|nr:PEGA domain-containing protein [Vicinamibacterales bacterium]